MKLSDMEISDDEKKFLALMIKPRSIPELAAKMNLSYSTIAQKLSVLHAKEYVTREKSANHNSFYTLNPKVIEP